MLGNWEGSIGWLSWGDLESDGGRAFVASWRNTAWVLFCSHGLSLESGCDVWASSSVLCPLMSYIAVADSCSIVFSLQPLIRLVACLLEAYYFPPLFIPALVPSPPTELLTGADPRPASASPTPSSHPTSPRPCPLPCPPVQPNPSSHPAPCPPAGPPPPCPSLRVQP